MFVGHLEEIDLRHRAGNVEQRVDAAECGERLIDHGLRSGGLRKIPFDDQRFSTGGFHRLGGLFQIGAVSRDKDQGRKIARKPDGRGLTDALAGPGDDGN